jgi:(p)ppGpp synthase/HD superfamily hydrolase
MGLFSARFDAALAFAVRAHGEQLRKGSTVPYVTHPFSVAVYLLLVGRAEDVAIAGLLHDVVEDTDVTVEVIRVEFGDRVAALVASVTEHKKEDGVERSWEIRKQEALEELVGADDDVVALKAADALHNVSTTKVAILRDGPSVWQRFKRGPRESLWYYGEIARLVRARLGDDRLAQYLDRAVEELRAIAGVPA